MNLEYVAIKEDDSKLLKDVAKSRLSLSNRLFNKLKLNHNIFINGNIAFANDIINEDDKIVINLDYKETDNIVPQKGDIKILFEDEWYLAVEKPADIVVHPCSYHPKDTLANYVKYYLNNDKMIRPVNRLDNGTSGIVLFAKNEYAQELFNKLKKDNVIKEYIALCEGILEQDEGIIDAPIARKEGSIIEREVNFDRGQKAITHYSVIKIISINDIKYSLVNVILKTGRTHQIRVHFSYIDHPLIGDTLYNPSFLNQKDRVYQALHAYKLEFTHPITHKSIIINSKRDLVKEYLKEK